MLLLEFSFSCFLMVAISPRANIVASARSNSSCSIAASMDWNNKGGRDADGFSHTLVRGAGR